VKQGAHLQLTNGSLLGELGESYQQCALALLECGLVSFVASDAHNTHTRQFTNWPATFEMLKEFESRSADDNGEAVLSAIDLCDTNPRKVLEGKSLPALDIDQEEELELRKRLSDFHHRPSVKRKRFFFF
jgi:protein-tyrosine phosphatase